MRAPGSNSTSRSFDKYSGRWMDNFAAKYHTTSTQSGLNSHKRYLGMSLRVSYHPRWKRLHKNQRWAFWLLNATHKRKTTTPDIHSIVMGVVTLPFRLNTALTVPKASGIEKTMKRYGDIFGCHRSWGRVGSWGSWLRSVRVLFVRLKDSRKMACKIISSCEIISLSSWKSMRLGPGLYFAIPFPLSSGSTLFPLSRWTLTSSMKSNPPAEVLPAGTIIDFGSYRAPPYSRGSTSFPLSANTTVVRSPSSWVSRQSLSIKFSTARAGFLVAEVAVTKPFSSSLSPTWIACVVGSSSEAGGGSKSLSDDRAVSLMRIEGWSLRTGSAEVRSKGRFVSVQSGLTECVVVLVPVVGTLADLFSRTSAPSLFVWSYSRSARGVGAVRIGHTHCESEGDGCSRVLYWFTPTVLEVQRGFRPPW